MNEKHKLAKAPYLNFNLHYLIKERKKLNEYAEQ
jgi:hypothetical protein